ncbi:MAG: hypothetical protein ACYTBY_07030 [Planctomycetota bacterium]|jgi:hypothetical protein
MNKYQKAVAYINGQNTDTYAELCRVTGVEVYISTDLGGLRLHEDEVDAMAEAWNRINPI